MNIVCIGGGPAGLYFGLLMKKQDPAHDIVVIERNRPVRHVRLGRGVLRPDARQPRRRRRADGADDPAVVQSLGRHRRLLQGAQGHVERPRLLRHRPQAAAQHPAGALRGARRPAGVRDQRRRRARRRGGLRRRPRDRLRRHQQRRFAPATPTSSSRTSRRAGAASSGSARRSVFDAFTFAFEETEHGWFQAHIYQFDGDTSTFIVETPEEVWQKAGLDRMSQEEGIAFCERLFAAQLDGHPLLSNAAHLRGSAIWITFPRIVCGNWVHWIDVDGRRGAGRADGRRGAHGALLDRLRHQARARGRDRARALLRDAWRRRHGPGALGLPGRALGRGAEDPERGAQLDGVVRERRALHAPRGRAVRVLDADAQPAHLAREPARARRAATSSATRTGSPTHAFAQAGAPMPRRRAAFRRC